MKLSCGIIEDILPLYADGICSEESRSAVEEHCGECENCSRKLAAMTASLPEKKVTGKPVNPIKKIVGHYAKIAVLTVICTLTAGLLIFKAIELTANENDMQAVGTSWSTMKCSWDFKQFGELFVKEKYYEAMCMADIKKYNISTVTKEEQDSIYKSYSDALKKFFNEYPIKNYSVKAYNHDYNDGEIRVEVSFWLETPNNAPVSLVYIFSKSRRDAENRFNIEQTNVVLSDKFDDTNTEHDVLENYLLDKANVDVLFPQFNYADNWFASHFFDDLSNGNYENAAELILTKKQQEIDERIYTMSRHLDLFGSYAYGSYGFEDEINSVRLETKDSLIKLFGDKYKISDNKYCSPYFSDKILYKDFVHNRNGCFMQDFEISLTDGNEEFTVSFSASVTNHAYIVLPAENIVFSQNAPEDFREKFTSLFSVE